MIPDQAINLVKHFEGLSLKVYKDLAGIRTCGWGHVLKPSDLIQEITQTQAEDFLMEDLQIAAYAIKRLILAPINDNQFSSLISFTLNLGSGRLQSSTLRQIINRKEYELVPPQFLRWIYCGPIKVPGLLIRRSAEAKLFMS